MEVFIIAAITADGFIGRDARHLADWTSAEDKKLFVELTKQAGHIVMGSKTFTTIGRALPGRHMIVYTTDPSKIMVEGVDTTSEPPTTLVNRLKKQDAHGLAICGGASIYDLFIRAGVVDYLYITVEPRLFGSGISLFNDELDVALKLIKSEKLNANTLLLKYAVNN